MLYLTFLFIVIVTTATLSTVKAVFSNEEQLAKVLQSLQSQQQVEGSQKTDALTNEDLEQHGSVENLQTFDNTHRKSAEEHMPSYNEHSLNQEALVKLLSKTKVPNKLLNSDLNDHELLEGRGGNQLDVEKYSKLYVVLNPQALGQKRAHVKKETPKISDLVSEVVSLIQQRKKDKNELQQYENYNRAKGFVVDQRRPSKFTNLRRWSRDDDRRDDDLDDFPKRPRHSYRGGGGGGGRTSIPYVKHRGDIYEREE